MHFTVRVARCRQHTNSHRLTMSKFKLRSLLPSSQYHYWRKDAFMGLPVRLKKRHWKLGVLCAQFVLFVAARYSFTSCTCMSPASSTILRRGEICSILIKLTEQAQRGSMEPFEVQAAQGLSSYCLACLLTRNAIACRIPRPLECCDIEPLTVDRHRAAHLLRLRTFVAYWPS